MPAPGSGAKRVGERVLAVIGLAVGVVADGHDRVGQGGALGVEHAAAHDQLAAAQRDQDLRAVVQVTDGNERAARRGEPVDRGPQGQEAFVEDARRDAVRVVEQDVERALGVGRAEELATGLGLRVDARALHALALEVADVDHQAQRVVRSDELFAVESHRLSRGLCGCLAFAGRARRLSFFGRRPCVLSARENLARLEGELACVGGGRIATREPQPQAQGDGDRGDALPAHEQTGQRAAGARTEAELKRQVFTLPVERADQAERPQTTVRIAFVELAAQALEPASQLRLDRVQRTSEVARDVRRRELVEVAQLEHGTVRFAERVDRFSENAVQHLAVEIVLERAGLDARGEQLDVPASHAAVAALERFHAQDVRHPAVEVREARRRMRQRREPGLLQDVVRIRLVVDEVLRDAPQVGVMLVGKLRSHGTSGTCMLLLAKGLVGVFQGTLRTFFFVP